jgi:hypothetical protein
MILIRARSREIALLAVGLLISILPLTGAAGGPVKDEKPDPRLESAVAGSRWREALRAFEALTAPAPEDRYLAGLSLMNLHQPEAAREHLERAKALGFRGFPGRPEADELLQRIEIVNQLQPPLRSIEGSSAPPAIAVHRGAFTRWSGPVLQAVPEFEAVGRRIFGPDLPPVRLVLFAERHVYERFYGAMFGVAVPTAWHDGTGNLNIVVFCEKDREGKESRPAGAPETIGNVLHEFGHAWCGSYLMDRHGKEWLGRSLRRPWLDEGLADYAASLREPEYLERRKGWLLRKVAQGVAPPAFEELTGYSEFYEKGDVDTHYWLSALLVEGLLGDSQRGPALIPKLLDAMAGSGEVDASVRSVTGKDPGKELERLIARLWPSSRAR